MERKTGAVAKSKTKSGKDEVLRYLSNKSSLSASKKVDYNYKYQSDAVVAESLYVIKDVSAVASVPKHATHYKMTHKRGGLALIFNHEFFDDLRLKPRTGAKEDCETIKRCLGGLGFDVRVFQDLKSDEIEAQIRSASKQDYTQHNCILIVVMSYGVMDNIYAKDFLYKPDYLWTSFRADKCPTLAGKPKMFFLQACAASEPEAVINSRMSQMDGEVVDSYRIPVQSDFLIVNSTAKGSWFVQALCKELEERALEQDLMTILTFVCQRVAMGLKYFESDAAKIHEQMPCVLSMLTRLIRFNPKW